MGPNDYGRRHFSRYEAERPRVLRVPFVAVVAMNPDSSPFVCRFNSGSPRCSGGRKSPRGPRTFIATTDFGRAPSDVVELTFLDGVALPPETETAATYDGPWSPIGD
jgi:hypothetical protein